jgi:methionine-rich copper-binding protein CopC
LTSAPTQVDIYTAQEMRKTAGANDIAVTASDGSRVDTGTTAIDDNDRRHFSVGLVGNLPPGRYLVAFKTLSDQDGEADHGSFAFYVGRQPTADEQAQDGKLTLTSQDEDASTSSSHIGLYAGVAGAVVVLLLVVGGVLLWRRHTAGTASPG